MEESQCLLYDIMRIDMLTLLWFFYSSDYFSYSFRLKIDLDACQSLQDQMLRSYAKKKISISLEPTRRNGRMSIF